MELLGERLIPASVDDTWAALNDPAVLKACIAGCESVDRTADDAFTAVVALKIGPVSARFKGNLKLTNVTPPTGYTIHFDGQGGIAGFGKGSADVALTPEGAQTKLAYHARATVGGKMAQIGSRLIDATASKLTEDFFRSFEAKMTASQAVADADQSTSAVAPAAVDGAVAVRPAAANADVKKLGWLIGAVVALAGLYVLLQK